MAFLETLIVETEWGFKPSVTLPSALDGSYRGRLVSYDGATVAAANGSTAKENLYLLDRLQTTAPYNPLAAPDASEVISAGEACFLHPIKFGVYTVSTDKHVSGTVSAGDLVEVDANGKFVKHTTGTPVARVVAVRTGFITVEPY